jgi:hypothetical protein
LAGRLVGGVVVVGRTVDSAASFSVFVIPSIAGHRRARVVRTDYADSPPGTQQDVAHGFG